MKGAKYTNARCMAKVTESKHARRGASLLIFNSQSPAVEVLPPPGAVCTIGVACFGTGALNYVRSRCKSVCCGAKKNPPHKIYTRHRMSHSYFILAPQITARCIESNPTKRKRAPATCRFEK